MAVQLYNKFIFTFEMFPLDYIRSRAVAQNNNYDLNFDFADTVVYCYCVIVVDICI